MQYQPEIVFRGFEPDQKLIRTIDKRLAHLESIFPRIIGCRVAIEQPNHSKKHGNLFHVRIEMSIPGKQLIVSQDPNQKNDYKDVYLAVKHTFDAANRRLIEFTDRRRQISA